MRKQPLNIAQLERMAGAHLSNFDGDLVNYDGVSDEWDDFSGSSADLVDFDGSQPDEAGAFFPQELNQGRSKKRIFQFTVTNAQLVDQSFYLNEGLDTGIAGVILADNAALVPISGVGVIGVAGKLKNLKYLRNFIRQNPTRILGFKIASTDALQIETNVSIETESPFHQALKSRQIVLADYQNEHTYRDKVVTVPEQFQLDEKTKVKMTVVANSSMTVTLYVGAVLNTSKALHKLAAKSSPGVAYSEGILSGKAAMLRASQLGLPAGR